MSRIADPISVFLETQHVGLAERLADHGQDWLAPILDPARPIEDRAREVGARLAAEGLFALAVPAIYGGSHLEADVRGVCLVREALARIHLTADFVFGTQVKSSYFIAQSAKEPLKSEILGEVVDGRRFGAFAAVEPGAGSDLSAIATSASRTSQAYFLDGVKSWVAMAGVADFFVIFARTEGEDSRRSLSAFYVPRDSEGLTVRPGPALTASLPVGELHLHRCRVPRAYRLGDEGSGWDLLQQTLTHFRPSAGASAIGLAGRALDEAVAHLRERRQFGRPLADLQALRFRIAEMSAELAAARALVYQAAWAIDRDGASPTAPLLPGQAKLFAVATARRIVDRAADLVGSASLVAGHPLERLSRQIRLLDAYLGTAEIQKTMIAREILGRRS